MKRLHLILFIIAIVAIVISCKKGDAGAAGSANPMGPVGPVGPIGIASGLAAFHLPVADFNDCQALGHYHMQPS